MPAAPIVLQRERTPQGLNTPTRVVTRQTVERMCQHIQDAQHDPLVRQTAFRICGEALLGKDRRDYTRAMSRPDQLTALWLWVKTHVKFVHDEVLIRRLLNESDHFELLISPPVLLRMRQPQGDCDDFTMLLLSFAMCCGFPARIITLACDRKRPGEYSHVYGAAQLSDSGLWCPLDASHGQRPGWEVPARDVQRRTEWDMNGQVVFDQTYGLKIPSRQSAVWDPRGLSGFAALENMPTIDTGLPVIGSIDLKNPLEWVTFGGALASLLFIKGPGKFAGAAGFLGARYMLSKVSL